MIVSKFSKNPDKILNTFINTSGLAGHPHGFTSQIAGFRIFLCLLCLSFLPSQMSQFLRLLYHSVENLPFHILSVTY